MNFYTVRDLRSTPKSIWDHLSLDGEVVITNNGKPTALLINIEEGSFEEGKSHDRFQFYAQPGRH